ncbi:hypothetical protein SEA_SATIS_180 [Streptomyces phage Satis]|nr:hypothetical protein SEA_SATIS_180 [Streptomyces phage Satis]
MSGEEVQDATPEAARKVPGEEMFISDALGMAGLACLLGPDIMADVLALPDGSPEYVMVAGGVFVARALLVRHLNRTGR